jgi:hypothetical protein
VHHFHPYPTGENIVICHIQLQENWEMISSDHSRRRIMVASVKVVNNGKQMWYSIVKYVFLENVRSMVHKILIHTQQIYILSLLILSHKLPPTE